jgi:hypothetical protein
MAWVRVPASCQRPPGPPRGLFGGRDGKGQERTRCRGRVWGPTKPLLASYDVRDACVRKVVPQRCCSRAKRRIRGPRSQTQANKLNSTYCFYPALTFFSFARARGGGHGAPGLDAVCAQVLLSKKKQSSWSCTKRKKKQGKGRHCFFLYRKMEKVNVAQEVGAYSPIFL